MNQIKYKDCKHLKFSTVTTVGINYGAISYQKEICEGCFTSKSYITKHITQGEKETK